MPVPVRPMTTSITPAIIVHMNRPSMPYCGDDAGDHDDERAGRAADLEARSAERRDQEAGDDRAVDAGLRRQARRDRERHRQRQRDQADGDAGDQIGEKGAAGRSRTASVWIDRGSHSGSARRHRALNDQNVAS